MNEQEKVIGGTSLLTGLNPKTFELGEEKRSHCLALACLETMICQIQGGPCARDASKAAIDRQNLFFFFTFCFVSAVFLSTWQIAVSGNNDPCFGKIGIKTLL